MKAAIVREAGSPPVLGDFAEPVPQNGELKITVNAAALSNVVKSKASGAHYSSSRMSAGGRFPFVVGIDGVGRLEDGRRVYFALPEPPHGSMAQETVVRASHCIPLPDDLDDITAAAIANPGVSAWAALGERAELKAGETVLVNGATGTAGRLAVQIAKYRGARRVIATGRDTAALETVGADVAIPLGDAGDAFEDALKAQFGGEGVDIVLDYLWGPSAERILIAGAKAGEDTVPIRFVHVGSMSAPNITLPGAALRSSAITLMGSGLGSIPLDRFVKSIGDLMKAAVPGGFTIDTRTVPLSEVESVWATAGNKPRTVFAID